MKPLISSKTKRTIEKCSEALRKKKIYFEVGDDPHHAGYTLISVNEENYTNSMNTIYPGRLSQGRNCPLFNPVYLRGKK